MRKFLLILPICLLLCLLMPVMTVADVAINATNFPDANFRKVVSEFDINHDNSLGDEEIARVKKIDCSGRRIASLRGIEFFRYCETLNCSNNRLTSLDISKNTALENLNCNVNLLKALDVSKNRKIYSLDCSCNPLTKLNVSNNTELMFFSCDNCQLTKLDVSKNSKLTTMSCRFNKLTELDVSSNPKLSYLHCNNNQIKSLNVKKNPELLELFCENNQLTELYIGKNSILDYLQCQNNQLTVLDVSGCTALAWLVCDNNKLTSMDVSRNVKFELLSIKSNQYEIVVGADRRFNLSSLPGSFNVSKTGNWVGGKVSGSILTVNRGVDQVTYTYDCGRGIKRTFILLVSEDNTISGIEKGTFRYAGSINNKEDSSATYYYSDSYFSIPATEGNPHLATMSLCLELASWTSHSMGKKTWNAEKATRNIYELLDKIGFKDPEVNSDWYSQPTMNSIGTVIAHKNINDSTVIVLSIRGGGYYSEWGGNFWLGESGNHAGFEAAKITALTNLNQYIATYQEKFKSNIKLWIVGYSRGGAVANMTAGWLTDHLKICGIPLEKKNIYAYTFEAPQGHYGSNNGYKNIHNYINDYDIVPLVAPSIWGFNRYNAMDYQFVSGGVNTKHYSELIKDMEDMFAEVVSGVPGSSQNSVTKYILERYAYQFDFEIESFNMGFMDTSVGYLDILAFIPDPYVKIQLVSPNYALPTEKMVSDSLTTLFSNIPGDRYGYTKTIENALTSIAEYFTSFDVDHIELLKKAFLSNNLQGMSKTITPIIHPLFYIFPLKQRIMWAAERAVDCLLGADPILAQTSTDELKVGLLSLLTTIIGSFADNPQQLIGLVYYAVTTGGQWHWPELTLAWLMSEDSYYTNKPTYRKEYPESYRVFSMKCPIDVMVYDENGTPFAYIIGDEVTNTSDAHGCSITQDGTKQVILPSDAAYTIVIEATDNGTMYFSVMEYNSRLNQYTMQQIYRQLPLEPGQTYTSYIPAMETADYRDTEGDGSQAKYSLIDNLGLSVIPSATLRGSQITYHNVELTTNNNRGFVKGSGDHVVGSYAQVEAQCMPTVEFLGWYKSNQLVSNDLVYRFEVTEDTELQARFSEGEFYTLTIQGTAGGIVPECSFDIPVGTNVMLTGRPDEGCSFVRWETNAGTIGNEQSIDTEFIMPSCDATVTAVFRIDTELPITGDDTHLRLYLVIMTCSIACLLLVIRKRRFTVSRE